MSQIIREMLLGVNTAFCYAVFISLTSGLNPILQRFHESKERAFIINILYNNSRFSLIPCTLQFPRKCNRIIVYLALKYIIAYVISIGQCYY
jgi:hypothetical protein